MGRGSSARQVLPLTEAPDSTQEHLLQLPFVAGGSLDLRWNNQDANFIVNHPSLHPITTGPLMSREFLAQALRDLKSPTETSRGTISVSMFVLAWNSNMAGPDLYIYRGRSESILVGTFTWDGLQKFLQVAHASGLF